MSNSYEIHQADETMGEMALNSSDVRPVEHNPVDVEQLWSKLTDLMSAAKNNLKTILNENLAITNSAPLKAQPISSYGLPAEGSFDSSIVSSGKRKLKQPCITTGRYALPLNLPQDFIENLPKIEEVLKLSNKMVQGGQLSLAQKLQGWTIEVRRRAGGEYDTYFNHEGIAWEFRSITGVNKYILYNDLETRSAKKKGNETRENKKARRVVSEVDGKKMVEDFLRESYDNFLHYRGDPAYYTSV